MTVLFPQPQQKRLSFVGQEIVNGYDKRRHKVVDGTYEASALIEWTDSLKAQGYKRVNRTVVDNLVTISGERGKVKVNLQFRHIGGGNYRQLFATTK